MRYIFYSDIGSLWEDESNFTFYEKGRVVNLEPFHIARLLRDNSINFTNPSIDDDNFFNEVNILYHCSGTDWLWFIGECPMVPLKGDVICKLLDVGKDISIPEVEVINRYVYGDYLFLEVHMKVILIDE